MQVFDEITKQFLPLSECERVVVKHLPGLVVLGYSSRRETVVDVMIETSSGTEVFRGDKELLKDHLVYNQSKGIYVSTIDFPEEALIYETNVKGQGGFPYSFDKRYEAVESFRLFDGKQRVLDKNTEYTLSKYLKYTFGLEFETSMGYIPEDICFRDGLIPLRDGSISGLEYSTVVLNGNDGLSLLKQELKSLKEYTAFNKECSLHIHLGGFPLDPNAIIRAQALCRLLEKDISQLVPPLTFRSSEYKANGKDYCSKLRPYRDFGQMYKDLVGRPFLGDLTQPHPNDVERRAKWRIPTRYYWVNFINLICYKVNKTIEFRLLRPTYNFKKIELWLYIFNAILMYAEDFSNSIDSRINIQTLLRRVYPEPIAKSVFMGTVRLRALVANQSANGDHIGHDIEFENELFPDNLTF